MSGGRIFKLSGVGVFALIALVAFAKTFKFIELKGNEIAVVQDVTPGVGKGVLSETWTGSRMYCGWTRKTFVYDLSTQKITFDGKAQNQEAEYDSIPVEIGENGGQKAWVSVSANYHLNPEKIVTLHNQGLGKSYESVVLKREVVDTVNEIARPHKSALDLFSGVGFVKFKDDIQKALKENDVLKNRGIDIESVIVYAVHLDPAYEAEIAAKQLAVQQKLTKEQQTLAAKEEANRIFALAQAKVEEARQLATAEKIKAVTEAEGSAERAVLAAEADKKKVVLEAEGKRDASLAEAEGIIARGKADAMKEQLLRDAMYDGPSGAWRAKVAIAQAQAEKLKGMLEGVKVVPEKTVLAMTDENNKLNIFASQEGV